MAKKTKKASRNEIYLMGLRKKDPPRLLDPVGPAHESLQENRKKTL